MGEKSRRLLNQTTNLIGFAFENSQDSFFSEETSNWHIIDIQAKEKHENHKKKKKKKVGSDMGLCSDDTMCGGRPKKT